MLHGISKHLITYFIQNNIAYYNTSVYDCIYENNFRTQAQISREKINYFWN